jgi:hypothetical protein
MTKSGNIGLRNGQRANRGRKRIWGGKFQSIAGQSPAYHDDRQRVNTLIIKCWFTAGKSATPLLREEVEGRGRNLGAMEKRFGWGSNSPVVLASIQKPNGSISTRENSEYQHDHNHRPSQSTGLLPEKII